MSDAMQITIIIPPVDGPEDADGISDNLRSITKIINSQDPSTASFGGLGGQYGYGAAFENDTFVMNPYYWGDCDCGFDHREEEWAANHEHNDTCYQSELTRRKLAAGWTKNAYIGLDGPDGLNYDEKRAIEDEIYADLIKEFGLTRAGCAVHCTCGHQDEWTSWIEKNGHTANCSLEQPNFLHKKSGLRVDWYKYIGREMNIATPDNADIEAVFQECITSLKTA